MRYIFALPLALAACSSSIENKDWTASNFRTATASGISVSLSNENSGSVSGAAGTAFFVAGTDNGARAFAGLSPELTPGATLPGGSVLSYSGRYGVVGLENINVTETGLNEGFLTGRPIDVRGDITLTANVDNGTLRGNAGDLRVSGTLDGRDIGGSVTYKGLRGALDGKIGLRGGVGAFHGNNDDMLFSGGFAVDNDAR